MPSTVQMPRFDTASVASPLFTTTVPRGYVHRASVSEVLLTGWENDTAAPGGPSDSFVVRAQLPRSHALFAPAGGHQDPMLLVESIRQAGILLAHAEYDAPFGHQFLMWDISLSATASALTTGPTPTDIELRTACRDIVRRGRTFAGMRYDVSVLRDGMPMATGSARFNCTSPAVHRRLRAGRPTTTGRPLPSPVHPGEVGHSNPQHVLLAGGPGGRRDGWELRVDTDHPIFFDHPVDHVPGMLLIEAARQAARAATGQPDALLVGLTSEFARYAELDAPCWISARDEGPDAAGDLRVRVEGVQQGERVFASDLVLRPRGR